MEQVSSSVCRRLHGLFAATSRRNTPKLTKPTETAGKNHPLTSNPLLTEDQRLEIIVNKFKKDSNSSRFRRRNANYFGPVLRLAVDKHFSHIETILEHQKKYTDITDERFTARLISLYGKSGMLDHAVKLFDEMPQLKCKRTVLSLNVLLAACVNSKRVDKINEFFCELPEKLSIQPDIVSYNTVVKAFCEMGSLDSAVLLIDEMGKNGLKPNLITYNTLLEAFYKNNRFSEAEKLWVVMESKNLITDVRTYSPKLRGLVANNRISEAVDLFDEMQKKGIKPDVFSLNALIKGYSENGSLEETKRWYGEMKNNECVPNRKTFSMLLPLACEKGDYDFAFELCKTAIGWKLVDAEALQSVVDGLLTESKAEAAKELVDLANSNNHYHDSLKLPIDE